MRTLMNSYYVAYTLMVPLQNPNPFSLTYLHTLRLQTEALTIHIHIHISRKDVPDCSEPFLEIKNPRTNTWQPFGKGKWNLDNITFVVPDLSFIEPPFLGDIEFRLTNNEGIPFYSSTGPNININFKNIKVNRASGTISVDVITTLCEENIMLQCHNKTFIDKYTGCDNWQTLTFGPINDLKDEDLYILSVCNE